MENKNDTENLVLRLKDKEECDYILVSLKKLPEWTNNVNSIKLQNLISTIAVIKEGLSKRF